VENVEAGNPYSKIPIPQPSDISVSEITTQWGSTPKRHLLSPNCVDWCITYVGRSRKFGFPLAREMKKLEKESTVAANYTHMGRRDISIDLYEF
jgi:hypothetical protein